MHEKVEHLSSQKTQRQNKLALPLLSLLLQILFNVNFSIPIFTSNIMNKINCYFCLFSLTVYFYYFLTFSNTFLLARILHKISELFILEFFELSTSFGGAIL